jgi:hypothetical protein
MLYRYGFLDVIRKLYNHVTILCIIPKKRDVKKMATKKQINNLVSLINEKYRFSDGNEEWSIKVEKGINGWQMALGPKTLWTVVLTQHRVVTSDVCLIILQMLYHDILERQNLKHYKVEKRV